MFSGEFITSCADCVVDASVFRGSRELILEALEELLKNTTTDPGMSCVARVISQAKHGEIEALRAYVKQPSREWSPPPEAPLRGVKRGGS